MCVLPMMTYGSQTWTMTMINMGRLIRTQRATNGVKNVVYNNEGQKAQHLDKSKDQSHRCKKKSNETEMQYVGHNATQVDNRWNTQILNWRPWLGKTTNEMQGYHQETCRLDLEAAGPRLERNWRDLHRQMDRRGLRRIGRLYFRPKHLDVTRSRDLTDEYKNEISKRTCFGSKLWIQLHNIVQILQTSLCARNALNQSNLLRGKRRFC